MTPARSPWIAITPYPADTLPGIGLQDYARNLAQHSWQSLSLSCRYESVPSTEEAQRALLEGSVDVADLHGATLAVSSHLLGLVSLPCLIRNPTQLRLLHDIGRAAFAAHFARSGLRLLYATPWPPTGIWAIHPVRTLADLRTLQVRTYDAGSALALSQMGITASAMPLAEALRRADAGEITGVLSSGDGVAGERLRRVLPHFTALAFAWPLSFTLLRESCYHALPASLRQAVEAAAADTQANLWHLLSARLTRNESAMRKHGITIQHALADDLQQQLAQTAMAARHAWHAGATSAQRELLARFDAACLSARQAERPSAPLD